MLFHRRINLVSKKKIANLERLAMFSKSRRAFTLLELMIVAVVITVLFVVSLAVYEKAKANTRDSRRVSDISSLGVAAHVAYDSNGQKILTSACDGRTYTVYDPALVKYLVPTYLQIMPHDPKHPLDGSDGVARTYDTQYLYITTNSSNYPQNAGATSCPADAGTKYPVFSAINGPSANYYFYATLENSGNSQKNNIVNDSSAQYVFNSSWTGADATAKPRFFVAGP